MTPDPLEALLNALALSPDNHLLRLMVADALRAAGRTGEAVEQYALLLDAEQLPRESLISVGHLCLAAGRPELALQCVARARVLGVVEGVAELGQATDAAYAERGFVKLKLPTAGLSAAETPSVPVEVSPPITFAAVGGLEEVKRTIHRMIILPQQRPDLYKAYNKRSGGGILMYGPPGCGKTLLARATAGECELPFLNIRIEDVLDPYMGVSERNLHLAFEEARANAPCVLFLDEVDALAYARRKQRGSAARALVDQMLQELDAIGAENQGLLVLAATNAPWDVDDALLRPGRLDRRIFVPPPDEGARLRILERLLDGVPTQALDLPRLAKETTLWSGADLRALVEQATEQAIEEALDAGEVRPVTARHVQRVQAAMQPTTIDWLRQAQNYVEFANQDGRYNEVTAFLRSPDVKRRMKS